MSTKKLTPLKRLLRLIQLEKKEIISIYFYAILNGLMQLSVPVGVQAIIGFVLGATMVTSIYILIALVVLGVLFVGIFQMNQMKIIEKIQQRIFTRNAFEFAEKIPRFDLKKTDSLYLPETINRFFDTLTVQKGLSKLLLDIPTATIQILFGLLLLMFYHPLFILFGLLLVIILSIILKFTGNKGFRTSLEESTYKYEVVSWLEEIARSVKSFKFSQGTHLNLERADNKILGYLNSRTAHFKVLLAQYRVLIFFKVAITTAMLTVGTYLLLTQQLNIGEFIAAEIVILTVISAVEKMISRLDNIYDVITGLEKLANVTEIPEENDGKALYEPIKPGMEIDLQNVSFGYHNKHTVLNNINMHIKGGSTVCIRGEESSGKSTLLKILSGNYHDFNGSILINNIPIANYSLESYRKNTGVYMHIQDIFKGTVWENISMGKKEMTPAMISATATKLGIENFLNNLPNGYESQIDSSGKKLSTSLIRKILLLRAFVHQPALLLLEEPWAGQIEPVKNKIKQFILNECTHSTVIVTTNDKEFAASCTDTFEFNENGTLKK